VLERTLALPVERAQTAPPSVGTNGPESQVLADPIYRCAPVGVGLSGALVCCLRAYWQASQFSGFSREQASASASVKTLASIGVIVVVWVMRVAGRERR